jgi:hypothetical protein
MASEPTLAVCDADAFYPFRSLVTGQLSDPKELEAVERFLRLIVLHDEIGMDLEPMPYFEEEEREWTEEEINAGGRNVIVAFGPTIEEYGLFGEGYRARLQPSTINLSPKILQIAAEHSNASEGNVYYDAHVQYLQRLFGVISVGGSVLCEGAFGRESLDKASEFPAELFNSLDEGWQEYAKRIRGGELGLLIPPVLAIVLSRCARRDAIPAVVRDLREEWAEGRRKVWQLVDELKHARTLRQVNGIERGLREASRQFDPRKLAQGSSPIRMLWDLTVAGAEGAAIGSVTGTGTIVGALGKVIGQAFHAMRGSSLSADVIHREAFDLASRVSHAAATVEADPAMLSRFLTDEEKKALGYAK